MPTAKRPPCRPGFARDLKICRNENRGESEAGQDAGGTDAAVSLFFLFNRNVIFLQPLKEGGLSSKGIGNLAAGS